MDDPQTVSLGFFGPVAAAYLSAAALWLLYERHRHLRASEPPLENSTRPYLDLLLTVAAMLGIFLWGEAYRRHWLLPSGTSPSGRIGWIIDNLIIFSPIPLVLWLRGQTGQTVFVSATRLPEKIVLGISLGVIAVTIYSSLRSEIQSVPGYLLAAVMPEKLVDFLPVFMEGVAVVFAFVRLRWVVGTAGAILVPSLLFAAAHVPGSLAEGRDFGHIAAFFIFNTLLPAGIFAAVIYSRDVIWLGIVHYLMDIAIRAI